MKVYVDSIERSFVRENVLKKLEESKNPNGYVIGDEKKKIRYSWVINREEIPGLFVGEKIDLFSDDEVFSYNDSYEVDYETGVKPYKVYTILVEKGLYGSFEKYIDSEWVKRLKKTVADTFYSTKKTEKRIPVSWNYNVYLP